MPIIYWGPGLRQARARNIVTVACRYMRMVIFILSGLFSLWRERLAGCRRRWDDVANARGASCSYASGTSFICMQETLISASHDGPHYSRCTSGDRLLGVPLRLLFHDCDSAAADRTHHKSPCGRPDMRHAVRLTSRQISAEVICLRQARWAFSGSTMHFAACRAVRLEALAHCQRQETVPRYGPAGIIAHIHLTSAISPRLVGRH